MALVSRTVYMATEDGTAETSFWYWVPQSGRLSPSPFCDTLEECVTWCEGVIQDALDFIATITPEMAGFGEYRAPRYIIYTNTEVRDDGTPTSFTDPTYE